MDQLFAPWRIEWVRREGRPAADDGCVFCSLRSADDDRESLVVARGETTYVVLNNYPYNPGHVMVVPHRHTGRLQDLDGDLAGEFAATTRRTLAAIEAAMGPEGFNVGMNLGTAAAGGSIGEHLHRHVVPRWGGDTNYMPVIGETKVIVQALEDTYEELHAAFAALDGATADGDGAVRLRQG